MDEALDLNLRNYPLWLPYMMALLTICTGVFSSITSSWMNRQDSPMCKDCPSVGYEGAMQQTQQMFIAEIAAFVVWFIDYRISARMQKLPLFDFVTSESELTGRQSRWYFWPICACCDFTATLMVNHAYTFAYAATVEMLRNFMVVVAAIFQMILIRKALLVHEWIGVFCITAAMIFTAMPAVLDSSEALNEHSAKETVFGVALAIGGTTVQAFQLLIEEFFFRKGRYPPLKAVGIEGITGLLLTFVAWPIYQSSGTENVTGSWYQVSANGRLLAIFLGYIPIGLVFNICGLGTTKLAGGLLRGICFAVRAPLVWILSMCIKWQSYDTYSLIGAIVFFGGFVVYCNFYGTLDEYNDWLTKPVSCFCTNPDLDDEPRVATLSARPSTMNPHVPSTRDENECVI